MSLVPFLAQPARRFAAAGFVALLPLYTGGWLSGPQSTFETAGPVAKTQLDVFMVTFWVTTVIFVIVAGILAYATLKFKIDPEASQKSEPPAQGHGNPLIELSLIAASVGALVIIAVPTLRAIWYTYDLPTELKADAYEVKATGLQWWFSFEYPAEQVDGAGPLVTANELVIPAGRPVHVELRTDDVIHSFWVPKLAGKVDMMPNRGNHLWLQADEPGYFWGQCAEYCGDSHAVMRFRVIALNAEDFSAWVEQQSKPARTVEAPDISGMPLPTVQFASYKRNAPGYTADFDETPFDHWQAQQFVNADEDPAMVAMGRKLFSEKHCITCHKVRGHEGVGIVGPDLTHVGSRTTIAGGLLENNDEFLLRWVVEPDKVKEGNQMYWGKKMPGYMKRAANGIDWERNFEVSPAEGKALVAYLHSLK